MSRKPQTDIGHGPAMDSFMNQVKQTVVQQQDYRGIGGHGPESHGPHGQHSQVSIGIGNDATVNIRREE